MPGPRYGASPDCVSFEPDKIEVSLDGRRLRLEPGQSVIPHGVDRDLSIERPSGRQRDQPAGPAPATGQLRTLVCCR